MSAEIAAALIGAGLGIVATLAGALIQHILSRGRFEFEKEERRRETQRRAIAELIAAGTDFAEKVHQLSPDVERSVTAENPSPEWIEFTAAAQETLGLIHGPRNAFYRALFNSRVTVIDTRVSDKVEAYGDAVGELQKLVTHSIHALERTTSYEPARAETVMPAYFDAFKALMEVSEERLRLQ